MPKFYLTTAIDYANGEPHLRHALEKIGADCLARYRRLCGDEVHFVMGMDEHGQKVAQSAEKGGLPPQAWVDRIAGRFQQTWRRLLCSNDDWIRTTEPRHRAAVTAFIGRIRARNPDDIFIGDYEGLYCVGCEEFKQESQIVDGRCVEHPTLELVKTKERNYFFRLSRYARRIHELIVSGEFRVEPEIRRNEVLRQIEAGLQDGSISRARFPWGIPFPDAPDHTVYVWFDALINYITAAGFPEPGFERLWPADLHVIGKGITRLHCALWPAMLLSAELALPRQVWAHGYVQWGAPRSPSRAGARSAWTRRSTSAVPTRCATSCCARSGSRTTATSPGSGSTPATRRSWRIRSGTWCPARSPCCTAIAAARCRATPLRTLPRSRRRRGRPSPRTRAPWTRSRSSRARRSGWSSRRAPTGTSRRPRRGSSRRRAGTRSSTRCSRPWPAPWPGSRC